VDELVLDGINGRRLALSGLLRDQPPTGSLSHCYYRAALTWAEGSVTTEVTDAGAGLAGFLSDLADAWQGFHGVREFVSMEGELTIACRYDGTAAVQCVVSLVRPPWNPPAWSVTVDIEFGAGAHIERIAGDAAQFFAVP
jgi:hypothetical protein